MGSSSSSTSGRQNVFIYNADFPWIKITEIRFMDNPHHAKWLSQYDSAHYSFAYAGGGYTRFEVQIWSSNGSDAKKLNELRFRTQVDHSWIVTREGVRRQLYGSGLSVPDPNGELIYWGSGMFGERKKRNTVTMRKRNNQSATPSEFLKNEVFPASMPISKLVVERERENKLVQRRNHTLAIPLMLPPASSVNLNQLLA